MSQKISRRAKSRGLNLVNCKIGNVSFQIDGPKLWTLSGINYKTHSIATRDSAYGTVLNIDGVGLLGNSLIFWT
jgi:hypothetical protein